MARPKMIKEVEFTFSPAFSKAINGVKKTKTKTAKAKTKTAKAKPAKTKKATTKTRKAKVTTKPIPKRLRREVSNKFGHFLKEGDKKAFSRARKKFYHSQNVFYDGRAIANEFGTANMSAQPFLRVSLESQQQTVSELVGMLLDQEIKNFIAKNPPTTVK